MEKQKSHKTMHNFWLKKIIVGKMVLEAEARKWLKANKDTILKNITFEF